VAELCDLYLADAPTRIQRKTRQPKKVSTLETDRGRINRHIKPLLGKMRVAAVTREDIEIFLADVASGKTKINEKTRPRGRAIVRGGEGTATRTVGLLGGVFSYAVEKGLRSDNPVRGVTRYKDRASNRYLSLVELAKLGAALAAAEHDGENAVAVAAVRLLILTGCRKSEILAARHEWVDMERGHLHLPDSKTDAKLVLLGAPALAVIASLPIVDGNPYLLPGSKEGMHYIGLPKAWGRIRARAGLHNVRLHDLRHAFASIGASSGDSLLIIGALLGHRDAKTTQRYAHLQADPVKAAADRISQRIATAMGADSKAT
jgi:integrase